MRIVDAQIHLWGRGLPSNMAHRQVTAFATEEAVRLMDEGGVDAAVIHPPGWDPNSTEMAFKAVRDHPGRFDILGSFPLNQPDKRGRLYTWRGQPGMRGLRSGFLHEPMRGWPMGRSTGCGPRPSAPACRSRCWRRTRWAPSAASRSAIRGSG